MSKFRFATAFALSCFSLSAQAQTAAPLYPRLSKTIDSLAAADQRPMRELMRDSISDSTRAHAYAADKAVLARHQPLLEAIVKKYGYPGFEQVGKESASYFWQLVERADAHPNFQRRVLKLMLPEVQRKNARPYDYARLTDRMAENAGQLQEYGTRVEWGGRAAPRSIRDLKNVNKRRAAIGMETLEKYLERYRRVYGPK